MEYNVNDVFITPTKLKAQREDIVLSLHSHSIPVMQTFIECALPHPAHREVIYVDQVALRPTSQNLN